MRTICVDAAPQQACGNVHDLDYEVYLKRVQERFMRNVAGGDLPLFTTEGADLWSLYLLSMDGAERPYHDCHACRDFIQHYGGLVTIDENGKQCSAIWDLADAPAEYRASIKAMIAAVEKAEVTGVWKSSLSTYGRPVTGQWRHFALGVPRAMVHRDKLRTAEQAMAEKKEDYENVCRALAEFSRKTVLMAHTLLRSNALYRSEKVLGQAEWLLSLYGAGSNKHNALWLAVATAPAGFCHPRSSMIGTLLTDLRDGLSVDDASRRFAAKMNPGSYQRPQAAPKAGTIDAAEKIVEKLGLEKSFRRRFARLEEIEAVWRRRNGGIDQARESLGRGGMFDQLRRGTDKNPMILPDATMTFDKFMRVIAPLAVSMTTLVPSRKDCFGAIVTAAVADSPPIFNYDNGALRNQFSQYLILHGSYAGRWGLQAGSRVHVNAIAERCAHWFGGYYPQYGVGAMFILEGCRDTENEDSAIFPELLRGDLHGIRSVVEAYSKLHPVEGAARATACGLLFGNDAMGIRVRVLMENGVQQDVTIDRRD